MVGKSRLKSGVIIRYPFSIVTVSLQLLVTDMLNVKVIANTTKVTSYVAEALLRYYEDQEELFLYLNKCHPHIEN